MTMTLAAQPPGTALDDWLAYQRIISASSSSSQPQPSAPRTARVEQEVALPPWAMLTSYSHTTVPENVQLSNTLAPLFPGAAGRADRPSQLLGTPHTETIDDMHRAQQALALPFPGSQGPALARMSTLNQAHHEMIDDFHRVQQSIIQESALTEAANTQIPTTPPQATATAEPEAVTDFDGDDLACSLCLEEFVTGVPTLRLICRHVFHIECWNDYLVAQEDPECPNCRGRGRVIARWRYIAPPVVV